MSNGRDRCESRWFIYSAPVGQCFVFIGIQRETITAKFIFRCRIKNDTKKKNKEPEKKWRRTVAARRKSADENKEEPSFFLLLFSREREREREKERNERKTEKKKNVSPRGPRNETNQPHLYGSFRASRAGFFHKLNRTLKLQEPPLPPPKKKWKKNKKESSGISIRFHRATDQKRQIYYKIFFLCLFTFISLSRSTKKTGRNSVKPLSKKLEIEWGKELCKDSSKLGKTR